MHFSVSYSQLLVTCSMHVVFCQIRLVLALFGVEFSKAVDLAFVSFLMLHAAVNPILYGVVRRTVRRTYWWGLRMAVAVVCCSERCRPKESLSEHALCTTHADLQVILVYSEHLFTADNCILHMWESRVDTSCQYIAARFCDEAAREL